MHLPLLMLVTPDAMLSSALDRALAEAYRLRQPANAPALRCVEELAPDAHVECALMVVDLRHLAPADVAASVARCDHPALVILAPRGLRTEAIPAGVCGALTHLSEEHELRLALEVVRSGQRYISPRFAAEDRLRYWQSATPPTERQREVFGLKQAGMTNAAIAEALSVSRKAVEAMATELRAALGVPAGEAFNWRDGRLP